MCPLSDRGYGGGITLIGVYTLPITLSAMSILSSMSKNLALPMQITHAPFNTLSPMTKTHHQYTHACILV